MNSTRAIVLKNRATCENLSTDMLRGYVEILRKGDFLMSDDARAGLIHITAVVRGAICRRERPTR